MARSFSVLFFIALAAQRGLAQASADVDPSEPVYRDIGILASAGLIDTVILGQWPYSQREIERMLNEAKRNLDRREDARQWAAPLIARDLDRWQTEPARLVDRATVELTGLDSPYRGIPPDGSGSIDAWVNPLVAFSEGRRYTDGLTLSVETQHEVAIGPHLALWLNPQVVGGIGVPPAGTNFAGQPVNAWFDSLGRGRTSTQSLALSLLGGAADAQFGNLRIGVGRQRIVFGESPNGGIVLSNDAPGLDAVRISNARPAPLPGFLRVFGPVKGTAFFADLGPNNTFRHAKLLGYKVSALFSPRFEAGVQVIDNTWGQGAPQGTLAQHIYDMFPPLDEILTHHSYTFGHKFAGFDFRLNVPRFHGFELYGDGAVDDFDARRLKSSFLLDGGIVTGWAFSCILECGALGFRAEYHQTGIRYYTHGTFSTGYAENGFILGDPLGPRAIGIDLTLDGNSARFGYLSATATHEIRYGNLYTNGTTGPNNSGFYYQSIAAHPGEHRDRLMGTWRPQGRDRQVSWRATAGVERATDFEFLLGNNRTNLLGQVALEIRP